MQNSCKVIKIKNFVLLLAAMLMLVCGCAPETSDKRISVTIVDSVFYTTEQSCGKVDYGEDFTAKLKIRSGYEFVSCNYSDYRAEHSIDGVTLTFKHITRPSRVTVTCGKRQPIDDELHLECTIFYDYNGGTIGEETKRTEHYTVTQHLRPNTFNGAKLYRDGYALLGWNTRPDGSGEHIGLGSRVTVSDGGSITLYAEWVTSLDPEDLSFREIARGVLALTGYRGSGEEELFVIPSHIDGKEVVEIASSFTINMPCGTIASKTLVLPNTIKKIAGNSFLNSQFSEIYFSDNIEKIAENAFSYQFKTYHINACLPPCFQAVNNSVLFADNMDRLILNADKQKLVFFSGCSTAYGLVSPAVYREFNGKYEVFNMGMNGDINGAFQFEIILNYLCAGDVLVHAPEEMSSCQLMSAFYVNNIMFVMTEGNYDLLALADFSQNTGVFRAFFDYIEIKRDSDPCEYSDGRLGDFNGYGDYICSRPYDEETESERDVTYSDNEYCYAPELVTESSVEKLAAYYDAVTQKGGKVCFSYAPVNISARAGNEIVDKGFEFAEKMESLLAKFGYAPISDVQDYMFEGRYFFDSDYHLNDLGAALRTERLIEDLRAAGV